MDVTDITGILRAIRQGESGASEQLLPLVYEELRELARARMKQERADHTLDATALVHEAYLRLVGKEKIEWANQAHFFHAAAKAMQRILIEHARARAGPIRGGDRQKLDLQAVRGVAEMAQGASSEEILALDGAISRLEGEDAQAAAVVRLRFYAGLSVADTANALQISERTVKRDWAYARAYLFRILEET